MYFFNSEITHADEQMHIGNFPFVPFLTAVHRPYVMNLYKFIFHMASCDPQHFLNSSWSFLILRTTTFQKTGNFAHNILSNFVDRPTLNDVTRGSTVHFRNIFHSVTVNGDLSRWYSNLTYIVKMKHYVKYMCQMLLPRHRLIWGAENGGPENNGPENVGPAFSVDPLIYRNDCSAWTDKAFGNKT